MAENTAIGNVTFTCDGKGEIVALTDAVGNVVANYHYDAWGKNLGVTDASGNAITSSTHIGLINPIRYKGYYYDSETGLYYLNSRYYDPEVCRYISSDDVNLLGANGDSTSFNLFVYCGNNPVSRKDTTGNAWETVFDVASLGFSIIEVAANPYDPLAWLGLAGDLVDVIPFVTGVGEAIRGVRLVDKMGNTLEIARAVDFTDDVADTLKGLDRSSGFTKSNRFAGSDIHDHYKTGENFSDYFKEYTEIPGIRPDYYDEAANVIYELKPFNPRAAKAGVKQLQRYSSIINKNSVLRLEFY